MMQPDIEKVAVGDSELAWMRDSGIDAEPMKELAAMMKAAAAIAALNPVQKERVLAWLSDAFLCTHEIGDGEDISSLLEKNNSFSLARQIMNQHLRNSEGLLEGYRSNIAMRLHDLLHDMGYKPKLQPADRNNIADQLIHLIFSS